MSYLSTWKVVALALGFVAHTHAVAADPVAFVVNADSNSVSIVDVNAGITRDHVTTWDGVSPNAGREPKDVVFDPTSGRVFVAARARLVHFDGLVQGADWDDVSAQDEGSGVALDGAGRRVFMSHEQLQSQPHGTVTEFSIQDAANPTVIDVHTISDVPDLRFIAWDAVYQRVYVVDDDGTVARTGQANMRFSILMRGAAPNPGGILADPKGGIWVTRRAPGQIVRISENGSIMPFPIADTTHPRGMAWDVEVPGTILIAVDDDDAVVRFDPMTGAISNAMNTDDRPQDVAVTADGEIVSANRLSGGDGTVTIDGQTPAAADTEEKSIALTVAEVPHFPVVPASKAFCYNAIGDSDKQTFEVRNLRLDRRTVDLHPVFIQGLNPANYAVSSDSCSGARLGWGNTCRFDIHFTATGHSNQPAAPWWNKYTSAYYPATARVRTTDGSGDVSIPLRGNLYLKGCPNKPKITFQSQPTFILKGF